MPTHSSIKFIYFDVGGVLLAFYHTLKVLPEKWGIKPTEYVAFMKSIEYARSSGEMSEAQVEQELLSRFGAKIPPNYWASGQFVELFEPITPMHQLAYDLAAYYRLGLLTNVTETVWMRGQQDFKHLYPKIQWDQVVTSYTIQSAKPEKRIYEVAIERTGLKPEEICFIDDIPKNLETAQTLGMCVIQSYPDEIERTVQEARQLLLL